MTSYDFGRPYVEANTFPLFKALDSETAHAFGEVVRAFEMSNSEYGQRFQRLGRANRMKPPPSHLRIFAGYVVVRRLGTPSQYETWMPDSVFDDLYSPL